MISRWDYAVIAFYFAFMFGMGFVFRSFNKDASDYFRGGGSMVWWMVGASAFMTQFSAWTFTGAAGKAYTDGVLVAAIFVGNALGYFINFLWFSHRVRRLRVVTVMEAVRDRYGAANEQVFTWLQMPISIVYAGIWLNGLAIFMAAVFGFNMEATMLVTGVVVVVMSVSGGSWAVVASDFVQAMIIFVITLVVTFLAVNHPAVGGLGGLIEKVPASHINVFANDHAGIILVWIVAALVAQTVKTNSLLESYRYVCAKDDSHARKAALLACVLMLIGSCIWFLAPMAARIVQPDLAAEFPNLADKNPAEASFIFMGMQTLPMGMLGLLICGIFAATMSSMDSGLNRNAGIFVKNFYRPFFAKDATDKSLLVVGKIVSAVFGLIIIGAALFLNSLKDLDLFNIMILFGSLVAIPYTVPLLLGLIVRKAPSWAAWTTVVVGFALSVLISGVTIGGWEFAAKIKPEWFGFPTDLSGSRAGDAVYIISVFGNVLVCSLWYLGCCAFHGTAPEAYRRRVAVFFERMNTPVDFEAEHGENSDARQGTLLGRLCQLYGVFILLLGIVVPNDLGGRLAFLFCAIFIGGIGTVLDVRARRDKSRKEAAS